MSLPVFSTQLYPSVPHPFTPTIPLYSRTEDSTCAKRRHLETVLEDADQHWTAPFRDGLPTPPNDMAGVAYNSIPPSGYGGKFGGITLPPYAKALNYTRMVSDHHSTTTVSHSRPQCRPSLQDAPSSEPDSQKKVTSKSAVSYLQIPSSIDNSKGNLADFAAQMTCLFWFETTAKLNDIEERKNPLLYIVPEAIPSAGFLKWVTNILSTTQVSQNVILLALMFIYRLKKFNHRVRGKKGSEYRLMTIALMLGNKFLDDNTYTNKTWAEVSGISVQEIHVMEVEFLSNVRYNLFVSEEEWTQWHSKLGLFADFFNRAYATPEPKEPESSIPAFRISPNLGPSQLQVSPSPRLPSPPNSDVIRAQNWSLPSYVPPPHLGKEFPPMSSKKRSRDEYVEDQPSKRVAISNTIPTSVSTLPSAVLTGAPTLPPVLAATSASSAHMGISGSVSRLPRPNFPPASHTLAPSATTSVLPFPSVAGRAMHSVYNPSPNWVPQLPPTQVPPITSGLYNPSVSLPDPSRQHNSPFGVTSATISPAISAYSTHTPQPNLSPSFFLANRNSPYRPVRNFNTLLIPPPSSSLQQQRTVPFEHMHYQPLGKTAAERKTGVLPYLHHEAWPQAPFLQPTFHSTPRY
ncbi:cyclin-domain-containing protein [Aspergillus coremiiformis]|uniref:Cyclin-domain-containing protein n=1 Tax=Aspergillus coremiiformis TaxID=138285 RepID=A0A5N6Z1I2_9EURO|nr:cyclin-domain-containing protein [Aspergillus coremiiformis]